MIYNALGATTDLVTDKGRGHIILDNTPYDALQFMYENIEGSGVTKANPLK